MKSEVHRFLLAACLVIHLPAAGYGQKAKLVVDLGHGVWVYCAALSPNGHCVLTGSKDNTAWLWDAATGRGLRQLEGHSGAVGSAAFSPDGRWVLTGSEDNTARLWEAITGKELRQFEGHSSSVTSVAFSADGCWALTGSGDSSARLWDAETGKELRRFEGHADRVSSVAFSADRRWVLTGSNDKTARLWNAETGEELRRFEGHAERVSSVAFSPHGRWVLTGSDDKTARLWDAVTGKELRRLEGRDGWVNAVAFSPDGRWVLTGNGKYRDNLALLWDAATGKELRKFEGHADPVTSVGFSPDGRRALTGSFDRTARLWDTATGKELRRFEGHAYQVMSVAFSADGRWVLSGTLDQRTRLWDTAAGKELRRFEGHSGLVISAALSSDARWALTGSQDNTARLWEVATGKELRRFEGHTYPVCAVAFSPDARLVLTGSLDSPVRLWDAATGKELRRFNGHRSQVTSVAFSPDGRWVLTGSTDKTVRLWDTSDGRELRLFEGHADWINSAAFSPDGRWVLTGGDDKTARLWDAVSGKELRRFEGHANRVTSVAFSPDGGWVLTGGDDKTARLWDTATGKELRRFEGHVGPVASVVFAPSGRQALSGSWDGTARLWETATGKELCSLISFRDGTWAVVDPTGRFDAPNGGDVEGLHWVVQNEVIALNQLKERYYEFELLAKIVGSNREPLREVPAFNDVKLFPEVNFEPLSPGTTKLTIQLTNRGGGLGKVQIFVNGKEVVADARPVGFDSATARATLTADLAGAPFLSGQDNDIRVVAWNAEGYLSSRGVSLVHALPVKTETQPPELYAIIGGISKYSAQELQLQFAAKDAEDVARALQIGAKRLFGAEKVHLTLLTTSNRLQGLAPTKGNFRKAFEDVHRAKPEDILVVYLAGHGVSLQRESDMYCYLTQEARSTDATVLSDPAIRSQTTITSDELLEWTRPPKVNTLKQVMVLDTCAAGAAAIKLTEKRDISGDAIRAIERLKDRSGFHVLMGCASDAVSYEASRYGQGVLTYALLQGMRGAALRDDQFVDVSRLFQYTADQVPLLAQTIGGVQRPQIAAPRGTSFDVGQLTADDKRAIPLATVKPVLLRPMLMNPEELSDTLNLTKLLGRRLLEISYASIRGSERQSQVVYVDAEEMPGGVRPSGTYAVVNDKVLVKLVLRRDGQAVATLQVEGVKADVDGLTGKLVEAITEAAGRP